jgi:hypothetical protein
MSAHLTSGYYAGTARLKARGLLLKLPVINMQEAARGNTKAEHELDTNIDMAAVLDAHTGGVVALCGHADDDGSVHDALVFATAHRALAVLRELMRRAPGPVDLIAEARVVLRDADMGDEQ